MVRSRSRAGTRRCQYSRKSAERRQANISSDIVSSGGQPCWSEGVGVKRGSVAESTTLKCNVWRFAHAWIGRTRSSARGQTMCSVRLRTLANMVRRDGGGDLTLSVLGGIRSDAGRGALVAFPEGLAQAQTACQGCGTQRATCSSHTQRVGRECSVIRSACR
ncbi:hypothetical protein DAEQUDRAFT_318343 [Daedalea quercina L-15889]|uniref:Uncharacterized protein n=1 Tax=Daedalea quercina L-15889 TaxID=1314783 RepID=A0A165PX05_9APHY|nr:hypothetical protein DAEQUDRAFT_318343 [Daedalea quercina L-15889]